MMVKRLPRHDQGRVIFFGQLPIRRALKDHLVIAIELVPDDRVAESGEVNSDLMLTPGEELTLHERKAWDPLDDGPVCSALLSVCDAAHLQLDRARPR
jgi:hypothetical protein